MLSLHSRHTNFYIMPTQYVTDRISCHVLRPVKRKSSKTCNMWVMVRLIHLYAVVCLCQEYNSLTNNYTHNIIVIKGSVYTPNAKAS